MIAIGEASRLSGVSIETIRYYEREGIISKAGRTQSGRRAYSDAEISELRFIKRCRDLGFSIHDAVALRNLADAPSDACETVEQLGRKHLSDVRAKLVELRQLEKALAELVANCANGQSDCPMLDTLRARSSES
ncbi:MerR family transcriptional regulator [Sulfitobacter mediterraneus]|uniref:MerR family transcriptional regulator n=1 Tax=Sulfitobacter mediterraneus TaxID=83219 RepID=UPI00248F81E4|nr:MerR family transcriptional regulator [Sulfitobacter mediterraneus]